MHGPDPANPHPMNGFPQVCFIKNTIKGPNIEVGDYTYYDDPEDAAGKWTSWRGRGDGCPPEGIGRTSPYSPGEHEAITR